MMAAIWFDTVAMVWCHARGQVVHKVSDQALVGCGYCCINITVAKACCQMQ